MKATYFIIPGILFVIAAFFVDDVWSSFVLAAVAVALLMEGDRESRA